MHQVVGVLDPVPADLLAPEVVAHPARSRRKERVNGGAVGFAMFDGLEESSRDVGETYAERRRMLELADRSGFHCYHLAEHHATELSTVPAPNLFLSAVAQRPRRLRLGPLSYVLP